MNKTSNTISAIVEIGLFAAIGYVLDELQGIIFTNVFTAGGSIGFAMIAVLIISLRRGWLPGLLVGIIMGSLDLATKVYIITPWQVLLDYVLPYALVAVSGLFRPWFKKETSDNKRILILCLAALAGGLAKFLSHFIVGTLVWAPMGYDWAIPDATLYSFVYNFAFIGPSIVLCAILLIAIYKRAPQILMVSKEEKVEEVAKESKIKPIEHILNPTMFTLGALLFVYYMIQWLGSYKNKPGKVSFNGDYLTLMVTGLLLIVITTLFFILSIKKLQNYRLMINSFIILSISEVIYCISKIIKCYIEDYTDPLLYFIWMFVGFFLSAIFVTIDFLIKKDLAKGQSIKNIEEN